MPRRQVPNVIPNADGTFSVRVWAPKGHPGPKRPTFGPFKSSRDAERAGWRKLDEFESWDPAAPQPVEMLMFDALVDEFLATYDGSANSKKTLDERLAYARRAFGSRRVDAITTRDVIRWRADVASGKLRSPAAAEREQKAAAKAGRPERGVQPWGPHKALTQVLNYAVRTRRIATNPAEGVTNTAPQRDEIRPFESWEQIEAVAIELPDEFRPIPVFAAGTGLRPEEWIPLRRRDLELGGPVAYVHVRRVFTSGVLKEQTKQKGKGARRRVPLRAEVVDVLRDAGKLGPGGDPDELLFPDLRTGGLLDLHYWRSEWWNEAVDAAGIKPHRTPYALRHTYATFQLAAGINLYTLARRMGTSVKMIDETYGHLAPDFDEVEVERMDEYDRKLRAANEPSEPTSEAV